MCSVGHLVQWCAGIAREYRPLSDLAQSPLVRATHPKRSPKAHPLRSIQKVALPGLPRNPTRSNILTMKRSRLWSHHSMHDLLRGTRYHALERADEDLPGMQATSSSSANIRGTPQVWALIIVCISQPSSGTSLNCLVPRISVSHSYPPPLGFVGPGVRIRAQVGRMVGREDNRGQEHLLWGQPKNTEPGKVPFACILLIVEEVEAPNASFVNAKRDTDDVDDNCSSNALGRGGTAVVASSKARVQRSNFCLLAPESKPPVLDSSVLCKSDLSSLNPLFSTTLETTQEWDTAHNAFVTSTCEVED
ncbi:hypothetical protein R3P38DRAFT_3343484 [Favolaschia claudopus]|uniref:Uncharacterized protein n=1 Tax=Favolaschia claudopus TaxID=2862362 RepID=A0AAW0DR52_9AGAR